MRNKSFPVLVFTLCLFGFVSTQNLLEMLHSHDDLSEFLKLVDEDRVVKILLEERRVTLFAPTNEAMRQYKGEKTRKIVAYHVCNEDLTSEKLKKTSKITSQESNIALWVHSTRKGSNTYDSDIFINNAKIIRDDERGEGKGEEKHVQVLHVIDQVLEPIQAKRNAEVMNPNALQVMKGGTSYLSSEYDLTKFSKVVEEKKLSHIFSAEAPPTTYFIPISSELEQNRWNQVDEETISVHAVPREILFTRTVEEGKEYDSELHTNGLRIKVIMSNVKLDDGTRMWHAQSQTIVGDREHPQGIVSRKILKANIPVKNGVMHIIDKPLAIIDQSLSAFLTSEKEVRLNRFHHLLSNYGHDFLNQLLEENNVTLLAPNNDAFERIERKYNSLVSDKEKLKKILNFHLVQGSHMSFQDESNLNRQVNSKGCGEDDWCIRASEAKTLNGDNIVYFRLIKTTNNRSVLTVDGGGVNATVTQPDIATINGVVHIIDRVLGIPFTTVGERLLEDPDVRKTAELGEKKYGINEKLKESDTNYTYFAPNNEAWEKIERDMPSAAKKLFMKGEFHYHAKQILERHLLATGAYSMEDLYEMSRRDNMSIKTMRGNIEILRKGEEYTDGFNETESLNITGFQVRWGRKRLIANVVRPDVKCTNGMIHVIDTVLMEETDVVVSIGTSLGASLLTLLLLLITAKYL